MRRRSGDEKQVFFHPRRRFRFGADFDSIFPLLLFIPKISAASPCPLLKSLPRSEPPIPLASLLSRRKKWFASFIPWSRTSACVRWIFGAKTAD